MTPEPSYSAYLEAIGRDLEVAARRQARVRGRRRARLRVAALAVTAAVLLAGSALAGAGILGAPAPRVVQATLGSLWQKDGSDLAPIGSDFHDVARFGGDILYRSPGEEAGSVCFSIAADDPGAVPERDAGSCRDRSRPGHWPLGVLTKAVGGQQAIFGQVRAPGKASLLLERPGEPQAEVPIGIDGHFLVELPLLPARAGAPPVLGTLRLIDSGGRALASRTFIALRSDSPAPGIATSSEDS